jgi:hypothetical protein
MNSGRIVMEYQGIIASIDAELERLQEVRKLLGNGSTINQSLVRRAIKGTKTAKKRVLSPEARKRIADAQKKRWAQTKKLAGLSATSKKATKRASRKQASESKAPAKAEA